MISRLRFVRETTTTSILSQGREPSAKHDTFTNRIQFDIYNMTSISINYF